MFICEILEIYFEFVNKRKNIIEDKYNSKFDDYGDIIQEDRMKYFNDKLSKLRISEQIQALS